MNKRVLALANHHAFVGLASAALAGLVTLPFLGSVGLWDPWETHYAEVGRELLVRGDLIHPYWQDAWFFSKPVLTPWLAALGLWLTGERSSTGELPRLTEWGVRLPFALLAIVAVGVVAHGRRAALAACGAFTGLVLATTPMWLLVARQAMTDMPFVAPATIATAAFARVLLDRSASSRWAMLGWASAAVATLGKGLLGFGLPIAVLGTYVFLTTPREWAAHLRRLAPLRGLALFAAIALPWYLAMFAFDGVDNEGKTFFQRFILHDHFARFANGVHSTTSGSFTYFIEQGAFGFFPWLGLLPLAVERAVTKNEPLRRLSLLWAGFTFTLFTVSATRFHHYCLPMMPALAVLVGVTLDELVDERGSAPSLLIGAVLVAVVGRDLAQAPRKWVELFTYNHERPYPDALDVAHALTWGPSWLNSHAMAWGIGAAFGLGVIALAWRGRSTRRALVLMCGSAVVGALWLSWAHWVDFSQWTQRDLFARYWRQRGVDEPIAAFFMDWKGETFYSRNTVVQLGPANWEREFPSYLARAGRKWLLVEHARLRWLQQSIGPSHSVRLVEPALNGKFVLLAVDG